MTISEARPLALISCFLLLFGANGYKSRVQSLQASVASEARRLQLFHEIMNSVSTRSRWKNALHHHAVFLRNDHTVMNRGTLSQGYALKNEPNLGAERVAPFADAEALSPVWVRLYAYDRRVYTYNFYTLETTVKARDTIGGLS